MSDEKRHRIQGGLLGYWIGWFAGFCIIFKNVTIAGLSFFGGLIITVIILSRLKDTYENSLPEEYDYLRQMYKDARKEAKKEVKKKK